MYALSRRRPELMLLVSLLILAATIMGRLVVGPATYRPDDRATTPVKQTSADMIASWQEHLRHNPEDTAAYAQLGLALLERVRETADASLYTQADMAFAEALKRDPQQLEAVIGQGVLTLARHQFEEGLRWGEKARALNPYRTQSYGIIADAQIELGRYEAAEITLQKMVDTRPDPASYSRISYLRELYGDTAGAITAMKQALSGGMPTAESTLWTQVQLGHLYFNSGDLQQAEEIYAQALSLRPDYIYAFAGLARVRAAQGQYEEAIGDYQEIVERLPLPEFVIALGDLYYVTGESAQAETQYELVRAIQQLNAGAGIDVDLELALFDADHGVDPAQALRRAQAAYKHRPSIYGADVLAWALYHHGDYEAAQRYSQEALRLGTRDAMLHYHAGMIAYAQSDMAAARRYLQQALAINPAFSIRYAPQAQALLAKLTAEVP